MIWVSRPLEERLRERLVAVGDCLEWTGARDKNGYGKIRRSVEHGRAHARSHVVALELKLGRPLGPGLMALHTCDNPPCCKPEHLYEGTRLDNGRDVRERGTSPKKLQTHCIHGHKFTKSNTYLRPNGTRACVTCRNRRRAASRERTRT